jgi:hypothetical protein
VTVQTLETDSSLIEALAEVFGSVLCGRNPDTRADLLDLGLNSVLVAQSVVLARRRGIVFSPREVYLNRTIERLSKRVRASSSQAPGSSRDADTEPVPLTPTKAFGLVAGRGERYNIYAAWKVPPRVIDLDVLEAAIAWIIRNHEDLRLQFRRIPDGRLEQTIAAASPQTCLEQVDLSRRDSTEAAALAEDMMAEMQHGFKFRDEPLYRFAVFKLDPAGNAILFIMLHQFLTDAFGFRTLAETISEVYRALSTGKDPSACRDGAGQSVCWARRLHAYANGSARDEIATWKSLPWSDIRPLRCDFTPEQGRSRGTDLDLLNEADARRLFEIGKGLGCEPTLAERRRTLVTQGIVPAALDKGYSERLFSLSRREMAGGFGDFDVVALAALDSVKFLSATPVFWVDTWSSTRAGVFDDLDVATTLGNVSEVTPFVFSLEDGRTDADRLRAIRLARISMPCLGIGFRALKFLNEHPAERAALVDLPFPEVCINYRASLQYFRPRNLLGLEEYDGWTGQGTDDGGRKDRFQFRLSWDGERTDIAVRYDATAYSVDTAIDVTARFQARLEDLIDQTARRLN